MTPRERHLITKFGLTQEQYDILLDAQGGGCALCKKTPEEEGQSLAVDHDHKTGEIRGILCRYCNHRVVGRNRDPALLRRVAEYLDLGFTGLFVPIKKKRARRPRKVAHD